MFVPYNRPVDFLCESREKAHLEMPHSLADEELQLAVAMSESVSDHKKANECQVQRNFDQLLNSGSEKSFNETQYNEISFHHPGLIRNNRIFEKDYSAELLTGSQRDSFRVESEETLDITAMIRVGIVRIVLKLNVSRGDHFGTDIFSSNQLIIISCKYSNHNGFVKRLVSEKKSNLSQNFAWTSA